MQTRFLTAVTARFNPFRPKTRPLRLILSMLPTDARTKMKIKSTILPRDSQEPGLLHVVFQDGKEMRLDAEKLGIKGIEEEVDRHSRILARQKELAG